MKTTVTLDSKDVKEIIIKFLGVKPENVIPSKYSYSIVDMSENDIKNKIYPIAR